MKFLHTTLLIAGSVLTFVNAEILSPIYYVNGGNTCLGGVSDSEVTGYADGTPVMITDCGSYAEGLISPGFNDQQGNIKGGTPYDSCITLNEANKAIEFWKCMAGREQSFIMHANHTIGIASQPGQCLGVPNSKVGSQLGFSACGSELFNYTGSAS